MDLYDDKARRRFVNAELNKPDSEPMSLYSRSEILTVIDDEITSLSKKYQILATLISFVFCVPLAVFVFNPVNGLSQFYLFYHPFFLRKIAIVLGCLTNILIVVALNHRKIKKRTAFRISIILIVIGLLAFPNTIYVILQTAVFWLLFVYYLERSDIQEVQSSVKNLKTN